LTAKRADGPRRVIGWLTPGFGVKRWVVLLVLGTLVAGDGALDLIRDTAAARFLYRLSAGGPWHLALPLLALVGGVALAVWAARRVTSTVVEGALSPGAAELLRAYPEAVLSSRGPKVVVIGGGTGLSVLLRGLKTYTWNVTAVVAMSDDGGSSGRLRAEMGIPPPGDVRNCLVALADTEPLMERLFQHRMEAASGLSGHAFGNLFLAAMTQITGDFEEAIRQSSRVLAVRGQVLPSTLERVALVAELEDGRVVEGESRLAEAGSAVRRIRLNPVSPSPVPAALAAIADADLVVVGPGSLFTSVVPNLLVDGVAEALARTPALRVYVANLMTQPGETDGMDAADHVAALLRHAPGVLDAVVVNSRPVPPGDAERYRRSGAVPVAGAADRLRAMGLEVVAAPLLGAESPVRHDPDALARTLLQMYLRRRPRRDPRRLLDSYLLRESLRRRGYLLRAGG
jgi:uncharacterized cofD-like protein